MIFPTLGSFHSVFTTVGAQRFRELLPPDKNASLLNESNELVTQYKTRTVAELLRAGQTLLCNKDERSKR